MALDESAKGKGVWKSGKGKDVSVPRAVRSRIRPGKRCRRCLAINRAAATC